MKKTVKTAALLLGMGLTMAAGLQAQTYRWYTTTESEAWKEGKTKLQKNSFKTNAFVI